MKFTVAAAILVVGYLVFLFLIAHTVERVRRSGHSVADNSWVYSLSLAVYCTSWTFYGSVGRAAAHGLGFLPIYLGPTLIFFLAPTLLRRIVGYCRHAGITSVPDLLESLYGKGRTLGAMATFVLVVGVTPYIALQLKAVGSTFDLLTGREAVAGVLEDAAFWTAIALGIFSVLFGARTLDPSERHEGMVVAVAFDGLLKLLVFLALGAYATFEVGGGFDQLFRRAMERPELWRLFTLGPAPGTPLAEWFSLGVMSALAVVLLPRQFHMLAVENVRESHVVTSAWLFPAYLLLINLFVLPVALVGILEALPGHPDFYLLTLPLTQGRMDLAVIVYLGGVAAATGMVIVSSVALANMILHHPGVSLLGQHIPLLRRWWDGDLSRHLLYTKRFMIFAVILLGYGFNRWVGESHTLVNIGLLSFAAVTQFAPAVFLGLYWKGSTRSGALTGLTLGFLVWTYTLLLPSFAESGWLPLAFLEDGPLGIAFLRPRALFGLEGLDPWSHCLAWSAVFNLGIGVVVSLAGGTRHANREFSRVQLGWITRKDVEDLVARFLGPAKAREVMAPLPERPSPHVLVDVAERSLTAALGTPSARMILEGFAAWPRERAVEILDVFGGVTQTLAESRDTLERRLRELSVLHEASRAVSRSLDTDTLLTEVLELIKREFGFEYLAVRLLDNQGVLKIRQHVGLDSEYVEASAVPPSRDTYFGTCYLEARPVVVENTAQVTKQTLFKQLVRTVPVTAFIHAPMIHEGRPIGVMTAYASRGPMHFTEEFVDLFAALANQLALAVVNAQLYSEVQEYSVAMGEKVRQRTAELEAANARLRELDRLKSDFLSTVSHELRTPLTSIRSFSEILLRYDEDGSKQKEFVAIIHEEATRLTRMINDLLDLSKIEAGRVEFQVKPLGVRTQLAKAVELSRPLFQEKEVVVTVEVEAGAEQILADEDGLQRVLTNLLSNAAKFSPEASVVRVLARRRGAFAVLSVCDRGAGIPKQRLQDVFDRYTQVRDPEKAHPLGTGLGLSIAKEIVERMGGTIWAESEPGEGSTFSFTVPLADQS